MPARGEASATRGAFGLRSRAATRTIPVMVLTAKGDEDNEVRVFELGADDFLSKPFRARALSARLEAVLGRRRPH